MIGASLAGLVTARVLREHFAEVLVLDRDTFPAAPVARRGVPQSRHPHGLLARGQEALDELFDGFSAELSAAGAVTGDMQDDFTWYVDGRPLPRVVTGVRGTAVSRPLLEHTVRGRVESVAGIDIVPGTEVTGLRATADGSRVTGVELAADGERLTVGPVDLVVDAGGRASRTPGWLAGLGLPVPDEEGQDIEVSYVTRHYRRLPAHLGGRAGGSSPARPGNLRGGFVLAQEGDRFIVSLTGWFGEVPPAGHDGMLGWARGLDNPDVAEIVGRAEPLDEPVRMRFPRGTRRRYDRLAGFPAGYLVVGDGICSFNPIYGQGMTVLTLGALLLRELLRDGTDDLAGRFFPRMHQVAEVPWQIAYGNDARLVRAHRGVAGEDSAQERYMALLRQGALTDAGLATTFLRVTHLLDPVSRLSEPDIVERVMRVTGAAARQPSPVPGGN